ncbi:neutral/alkaline non-lysosomal ceramidase N-terminal domain-containing protein [Paenibacillus qinlingensis]|uniref:neutral/alkaline non-lysosomal ceramidase N-terminal domain-containing protein n=1 Tax=Paenibacillus qinlingensis TaxID=1837343 RepID=UPI001564B2E6|nr:neutral/alkaline non-lysosomal ceramidase N-terminal domain-containing protein [Paenibacillus qinlingensis]NQX60152.1 neutral/alkaline non-lysosomal ceramidase N-terminal domain-containing protein [Paenibacillus qinlingensis]
MKIGFGKMDITPRLPVTLGGYEHRNRQADSVHSKLYARCMAGESNGIRFAMISLDLLGLDQSLRKSVCELAAEQFGISAREISLIATHTHAAIDGIPNVLHKGLWTADEAHVPTDYCERLVTWIGLAIQQALSNMREAAMQWSVSTCSDFASNRRDTTVEADAEVYFLHVYDSDSCETFGGFLHFTCHPTVIGPDEVVVSSDYPGAAIAALERMYDGGIFLFANGAAGDISTRFTRKGSDSKEAERLGNQLVGSLQSSQPIASSSRYLYVKDESFQLRDQRSGEMLQVYLQWIDLGGMRLWLIPGEVFSSYAKLAKGHNQLIVGYANGYIGYIPDEQAWEIGGYEVDVGRLSKEDCMLFLRYAVEE